MNFVVPLLEIIINRGGNTGQKTKGTPTDRNEQREQKPNQSDERHIKETETKFKRSLLQLHHKTFRNGNTREIQNKQVLMGF